jgi:uncharacterized membrane protein YccC
MVLGGDCRLYRWHRHQLAGWGSRQSTATPFGTIVGIVVGLYFGSLVSGHTDLTLALVLVCIFFAFYAFQSAYAVMMFWVTIMVALLYSLLGLLQPSLLILRLEETAIGSVIGVVVIMTLLPLRTHQVLGSALGELLAAIGNVVDQAAGASANRSDNQKLIAAAWEIAEKTNALRDAIGPLNRSFYLNITLRLW